MCSFKFGKKWIGFELARSRLFFFHHCPALILVRCPLDPICNAGGGGGEETTAPGDSVAAQSDGVVARSSDDGHPPRCLLTSKLSSMLFKLHGGSSRGAAWRRGHAAWRRGH
jgi:hypothetical protein